MFEEIELGFVRHFVPAKKQSVVYVIAPKGAVDPRKRIVVFANFVESSHARKPEFMRLMLFTWGKLHSRATRRRVSIATMLGATESVSENRGGDV
jgi:hypothetical protein